MEKYQFKTNINCSGCIAKVTPFLKDNKNIKHWEVDTNDPRKLLTVEGEDLEKQDITETVKKAGFTIESI